MTVSATTFSFADDGPESRASVDELLNLASGDDFARWEAQLAATGNCANPVRLRPYRCRGPGHQRESRNLRHRQQARRGAAYPVRQSP